MSDKNPKETDWKLSSGVPAIQAGSRRFVHASTASSSGRQEASSVLASSSRFKPKRAREFLIAESKLQNYDDSELEQIYSAVLQDVRRRRDRTGSLAFLEMSKAQWKDELGVSLSVFNSIWSRVIQRLERDAMHSENNNTNKRIDWSCLMVGPNFQPDYDFSTGEIREEFQF